jgi:hypothetical protein
MKTNDKTTQLNSTAFGAFKVNDKTSRRAADYRAKRQSGIVHEIVEFTLLINNLVSLNPGMEISAIRQIAREMGMGYHL